MAEVTGTIGNEQVALNNAATEATLRLLLQATLSANKQTIESVSKIATKAGLDPAAVTAANNNLKAVGETSKTNTSLFYKLGVGTGVVEEGFRKVDAAITPLIGKLMDGTDKASDVFGQFARLGGPIGLVAELFGRLAGFQEKNLQTYQQLSQTGVNFNGSLTDMRMAAQNSYMTLDEFARVMKSNSGVFANLGGTVNGGAMAFSKLSNSLLKSEAGDYLRNLGYTSEQVNQGLGSYLAATGGRNKKEMQNTEALVKGATEYMGQLQGLADLTGQNREDLDKEMKERAKNAAWEAKLAQMTPEEKDKAVRGMANALAVGGKGAADAFQSKVMGVPPITKEAQMFTATMGKTNESVMRSAKNVTDSSKTLDDQNKEYVKSVRANQDDMKKFPLETQFALGAMNSEVAKQTQIGQANANRSSKITDDEIKGALDQKTKKEALAKSEVDNAVKSQKAVQELGQTLMSALMPAIQMLTPMIQGIVRGFGAIIETLVKFKIVTVGIVAALATYWAAQKIQNILEVAKSSQAAGGKGGVGGFLNASKSVLGGLTKRDGQSAGTAFFVEMSGGGGIGDLLEKGKKGKKVKTPKDLKGLKVPAGAGALAEGAAGVGKGALKFAGKAAGVAGVLAGLGMAASDFMDVSDKEKKGEITKAEADKQKGGIVGEAGGGLAGAAGGAIAGAAIGSVVPIIGTVIGGLIGGAIGGFGGGVLGKMGGEALMGPKDGAKEIPKHADGGIATKPTMGIFGEAGPEALIPLNKIPKMTDSAMDYAKMDNRTSSMDKIKDMLGSLGSKIPLVGAAQQAGGAMSSMLGGITGSKGTETLSKEIETLNKNTIEMLKQLKDIADHTKQGVSATKSLSGDLFKF